MQADVGYALEGSVAVGGSGVRWLRDNLGAIKSAEDSESIAGSVPDSAGQCLFHGFLLENERYSAWVFVCKEYCISLKGCSHSFSNLTSLLSHTFPLRI